MIFRVLVCAALPLLCQAQDACSGLDAALRFETREGWNGWPDGTVFFNDKANVRLERRAGSPEAFSAINRALPVSFAGTRLELRGFLRTENVDGFAGLWLREDGDSGVVAFDNMQSRRLRGTTDWTEYTITLPLRDTAKTVVFGVLLSGAGTVWADNLQLLVDGKPVCQAPKVERPKTSLDSDHEFDGGSRVVLDALTKAQIDNLVTLGKVWGFLKYHHPLVASGGRHWDYDLFRILPAILAAPDRPAADAAIRRWIGGLGEVRDCVTCAGMKETNLHLRPELEWLNPALRSIHRNRPLKQFFVSMTPGVGNPVFQNEPAYPGVKLPDAGYQLLAVYRFWNMIEYWFPYRDVIGEDRDKVLAEFIPRVALAKTAEAYQRELMALIATVHDTHANLWSSLHLRPPAGNCEVRVPVRFVQNRAAVTGAGAGLQAGDVITAIDGVPVAELVKRWSPYYAASNQPTRLRDIARSLTRGECGATKLSVIRGAETLEVAATREPVWAQTGPPTHDLPGDTFRLLPDKIAYLKLSSIKIADVPGYIDAAAGTKGLIIDLRNYPAQFVVFALGSRLVEKNTEFARFTAGDLANPGAFYWGQPVSLQPQQPHYSGKVVILVDEVTLSSAEYHTMAFRAAPGAIVVGSTTAGADGNISRIPLPGGLHAMMSGIGVFYPDKRPTQRVGMLPDVVVTPTLEGIRAGKDEVLEEAVRRILKN